MSTDFFIIDFAWARKYHMFPLDFIEFDERYGDLLYSQGKQTQLEKLFLARYMRSLKRNLNMPISYSALVGSMRYLHEREPVHSNKTPSDNSQRIMHFPEIGLLTHHEPLEKKEILCLDPEMKVVGPHMQKLLIEDDVSYYNNSVRKHDQYEV